ncbi:MAG: hypothetical protein PHX05_08635 [Acidobacteriota bacterium]|nr:hypothetical protein [Acidobacteriota bacterium]
MGMTPLKFLIAGLGFVVIFLTGFVLRRTGQPFPAGILTVHKLVTVATIAFLAKIVLGMTKLAPLGQVEWIACIAAGAFFLLAIASGGWLSAVREMPAMVRVLHLILPFLTALSTAAFLYLMFRRR